MLNNKIADKRRKEIATKIEAICDVDKWVLLQYPASLRQVYTLADAERLYKELQK